jgi:glutamate synthase domain-containing protein 2
MPMREGLVFVRNALIGINARERIRIGCSGKIVNGFDMARAMALGADWCNAARGFMFALGCIQSMSCHTDRCPTGVATQDRTRSRALVIADKTERVRRYHASMLHALAELTAAAGLDHPQEFGPEHFSRRINANESMTYAELYPALKRGELLTGAHDKRWRDMWDRAWPNSFAPASS